jgi:hypothetical protein
VGNAAKPRILRANGAKRKKKRYAGKLVKVRDPTAPIIIA